MSLYGDQLRSFFGTDGVRGVYGVFPICEAFAYLLGRCLGRWARAQGGGAARLVVGYDPRESGPGLEDAFVYGVQEQREVEVVRLGVITTPMCGFMTAHHRAQYGVMISASHNPYQDNGFKVFSGQGLKLTARQQEALSVRIGVMMKTVEEQQQRGRGQPSRRREGLACCYASPTSGVLSPYAECLTGRFGSRLCSSLAAVPAAGTKGGEAEHHSALHYRYRVVWDLAHGSLSHLAPVWGHNMLKHSRFVLSCIHHQPDGRNINQRCGATDLSSLREQMVHLRAHFGMAFDGDGDRLQVVEGDRTVPTEALLVLLALWLQKKNRLECHTVVTTVLANLALDHYLKEHGIQVVRTPVGDRHLQAEMQEHGYVLAGEPSGHVILNSQRDGAPRGGGVQGADGLVAALTLLQYVSEWEGQGERFSWCAATRDFVLYPSCQVSVKVASKPALSAMPDLQCYVQRVQQMVVERYQGRIIWRYSGTESTLRILVEGREMDRGEEVMTDLAQEMAQRSLREIERHGVET